MCVYVYVRVTESVLCVCVSLCYKDWKIVRVQESERVGERDSVCTCKCVLQRERERERVCVCVCVFKKVRE